MCKRQKLANCERFCSQVLLKLIHVFPGLYLHFYCPNFFSTTSKHCQGHESTNKASLAPGLSSCIEKLRCSQFLTSIVILVPSVVKVVKVFPVNFKTKPSNQIFTHLFRHFSVFETLLETPSWVHDVFCEHPRCFC